MATALVRKFALDAGPEQNDRADMNPDWPDPLPYRYVVRTIDINTIGGRLLASFRNSSPPQQVPGGGIGEVLDELLQNQPLNAFLALGAAPGSPIDLVLTGEPTFVIYMLGDPDNARFHPGLKAMTHKNVLDRGYYGRLRHVTTAGESALPVDDCQLIYFVASPPQPDETPYRHRFNLNVRFEQVPSRLGSPQVLDIEIDPDIRYPGV